MRRYILLFIFASLMLPSIGQTGKKTTRTVRKSKTTAIKKTGSINQLRTERKNMQTKIKSSKRQSESLNRMIKQNLDSVFILDRQITEVQQDVMKHQAEIKVLDGRIVALQGQMEKLQNELNDKKSKYANALKYVRKHHSIQEKMMFIFSAENLSQMLRRLRYMREYSAFQKAQGQIILDKQREIKNTRNELLDAKSKKAYNLAEIQKKQQALVGIKSNCQVKIIVTRIFSRLRLSLQNIRNATRNSMTRLTALFRWKSKLLERGQKPNVRGRRLRPSVELRN